MTYPLFIDHRYKHGVVSDTIITLSVFRDAQVLEMFFCVFSFSPKEDGCKVRNSLGVQSN